MPVGLLECGAVSECCWPATIGLVVKLVQQQPYRYRCMYGRGCAEGADKNWAESIRHDSMVHASDSISLKIARPGHEGEADKPVPLCI